MSKHLSQDEFFTALTALFTTQKQTQKGTVLLSQKRLTYDPSQKASSPSPEQQQQQQQQDEEQEDPFLSLSTPLPPAPILIRATNAKSQEGRKEGKKVKLSTVVQPDELDAFYLRYAEVCKAGMSGLKPRDRTKRKAKEKARRKMKAQA
ncbi:signal recognition particle, SRP14 subunit [Apiosordaria backusii]|uniref:Signal recognition particle subunit SRP14 n=1 Tax=Apiosordaria backusii TaxID=314023 RepID=A0AA40DSW9_9PEZI|nr:signal recognition particle, SRP14 subunit [Apiosordaria backusii]